MEKTPEEILAEEAGTGKAQRGQRHLHRGHREREEAGSGSDAFSDTDAREERIELDNDTVDTWSTTARRSPTRRDRRTETTVASRVATQHRVIPGLANICDFKGNTYNRDSLLHEADMSS